MRDSIIFAQGMQRQIASDDWLLAIKSGGYRAIIFDCDGTLVNSSDAHFRSFQSALHAQGHVLERDWYNARTGLDRKSTFLAFASQTTDPVDIASATRQSIADFIANSADVLPIAETATIVRHLSPDYAMAVGTNAEAEVAQASLKATGLLGYFDHITSISDGLPPKPSPGIFQHAAARLGFSARETLVIEDSDEGVQAALSADLDVIKLV
jgi:HAD superfamily hydrolase (TIGR01509 family)